MIVVMENPGAMIRVLEKGSLHLLDCTHKGAIQNAVSGLLILFLGFYPAELAA
jgi:hypothetical protein